MHSVIESGMKLPIPVNVVTGALGVGKTTAISQLLRLKPPEEKWAVLVNEFGALGIDGALLESAGAAATGELLVRTDPAGNRDSRLSDECLLSFALQGLVLLSAS